VAAVAFLREGAWRLLNSIDVERISTKQRTTGRVMDVNYFYDLQE